MPPTTETATPVPSAPDNAGRPKARKGKVILILILLAGLATAGRLLWHGYYFEETDNAYLAAHVSVVAPRINGVIQKVLVQDNQWVNAGDVLLELDTADQELKIAEIKARMIQTDEEIRRLGELLKENRANAGAAEALVSRAQAQQARDQAEANRVSALRALESKAVSKSELETAQAALNVSTAEVRAQKFRADAANSHLGTLEAERTTSIAQKKVLAAQLNDAQLQRSYTRIVAAVAGRIGKKNAEVGARVQAGQQLLAIVQNGVWVTANFKETQLQGLFVGQKAQIRIDAFGSQTFTGKIDSFSPASGAQFALLPPDNATGNFTKIVQRIPVKILLDPAVERSLASRLSPGMSAEVEVDLRQGDPGKATSN